MTLSPSDNQNTMLLDTLISREDVTEDIVRNLESFALYYKNSDLMAHLDDQEVLFHHLLERLREEIEVCSETVISSVRPAFDNHYTKLSEAAKRHYWSNDRPGLINDYLWETWRGFGLQ